MLYWQCPTLTDIYERIVMLMTQDRLLTKTEVAALLGVSERTIDRWVKLKKISPNPNGKRPKFSATTIERYINGEETPLDTV